MIMSVTGYLAADPDIKEIGDAKVCNFRLGHNRRTKIEGEWTDTTDWYSVAVWGAQAEACKQYLAQGRKVTVEGRLEPRGYTDKEGNERLSLDVRAYNVEFHGGGSGGSGQRASEEPTPAAAQAGDDPLDF